MTRSPCGLNTDTAFSRAHSSLHGTRNPLHSFTPQSHNETHSLILFQCSTKQHTHIRTAKVHEMLFDGIFLSQQPTRFINPGCCCQWKARGISALPERVSERLLSQDMALQLSQEFRGAIRAKIISQLLLNQSRA